MIENGGCGYCNISEDEFMVGLSCNVCAIARRLDCENLTICLECDKANNYYQDGDICAYCNNSLNFFLENSTC